MSRAARVLIASLLFAAGLLPVDGASAQQVWRWSQTTGSNSIADPAINWATGMSPSAVSPSARAMMAAVARYRDDVSGLLTTTGTSSAYTATTSQGLCTSSSTPQDGQELAITMSATNGTAPTFQPDVCTAFPIQSSSNVAVASGTLVQGTPYTLKFSVTNSAWMLRDFYSNPYQVPLGAMLDYTGSTAPNSNFVIPYGQCISRTVYSAYFTLVGTAFGSCDGTTTFGVPDMRGRVAAGADGMGGSLAGRLNASGGMNGTGMGAVGGTQTQTLITANLPPYAPAGTITNGAISETGNSISGANSAGSNNDGGNAIPNGTLATHNFSQAASTFAGTAQGGTSTPVAIIQPTLVVYKILRVL